MIDLVEQLAAALKKVKAEVIDNEFTLDDVCKIIRSNTGCDVDPHGRQVISDVLSRRRDLRPLDADGGKWCFGSYTPPVPAAVEKTIETAA